MKRRSMFITAAVLTAAGGVPLAIVGATTVAASPGAGASSTIVARGTTPDDVKIHINTPSDFVFQKVTLTPGGYTGWHTHPGPLLVVVESGTLTHYEADCSFETYRAGQAFVEHPGDRAVHMGANRGSADVVLDVTYVVPSGGPLRNEAAPPACAATL